MLNDEFWEVTDEERPKPPKPRRKPDTGPDDEDLDAIVPGTSLTLPVGKLTGGHLEQARDLLKQVFPLALQHAPNHRGNNQGLVFDIGHHGLVLKLVDGVLRTFLQEGQLVTLPVRSPGSPYPSGSKLVLVQAASGSFTSLGSYTGWLSWASHQIVKWAKTDLLTAFFQNDCLGIAVYKGFRAAWVLKSCGMTVTDALDDLPYRLNWTLSPSGESSVAQVQRVGHVGPVGGMAVSHKPGADVWVYGGKIFTGKINPAIQVKSLEDRIEVPRSILPPDHAVACQALQAMANISYVAMLLNFLMQDCHITGLRTADLG